MLEGTGSTHPLTAAAAAATGLPEGLPVVLGYLDVLCTALGGGIYEPGRAIGCSIVGSTGMHMRFVPDAPSLRLGPEPSGYTMPFPVPGSVAQMQSNMAATLNIDWVVDRAREAAELLGHPFDRKTTLATLDARVLDAKPAAALYHPYIHEAGERGPFVDVNARAQFTGLSMRTSFLDLVRACMRAWRSPPATATPPWAMCRTRCGSPAAPPARGRSRPSSPARSTRRSARVRARKPVLPVPR